ncbi:hypothetical protein [Actinomadura formosensis]|uniref:hypothetical protein n=1 Tax=Actinomadura formosensis TaxID=60706 RepID=UPI000B07E912|nr:hypothetical protein [Actinomadura formosensis]
MSEPQHRGKPGRAGPPPSFGASSSPVRWEEEAADPLVVWVRWHVVELAGVGVPLGLGVAVSWWFVLLAAGVAGVWASQETRQAHRHRQLNTAAPTAIDASEETE